MGTKDLSIEELTKKLAAEAPVRKSRATGRPVPADGWWFPDFVPAWARVLGREQYAALFNLSSARWELEFNWKKSGGDKPLRGRPRLTSEEDDLRFILEVESVRQVLDVEGKRPSVVGALKIITGKAKVGAERARYMRALKAVQKSADK